MKELDNFYLSLQEPDRSVFIALRQLILSLDSNLTPEWKYKLPFFYYKGKMFCYLWVHKKFKQPYIGIMDGHQLDYPELLQAVRKRVKILLVDPSKDIDVNKIKVILKEALKLL